MAPNQTQLPVWRLAFRGLCAWLGVSSSLALAWQDTPPSPPSATRRPTSGGPTPTTAAAAVVAAPRPLPPPMADDQSSATPRRDPNVIRSGSETAASAPDAPTVLLLSNGHVFQGEILEDGSGYYLRHKIGVKQFARRNVAGVFATLQEAYDYLLARTPRQDPDEQLKLALWCLEQKLDEPARDRLEAVLALSPDNNRARAMLFHLKSVNQAPTDPEVAQASTDVVDEFPSGAPRPLNLDRLRELNRERGNGSGPPLIFELPPAVAIRRYQEFARSVHVELQNHCARCHDADSYTGRFQLYRARARKDLANELILRANLDAVLGLVDPDDLNHSRLLSVAAMTHPPDGKPVLGGPNHPSYRVLLNWTRSLADPGSQPGPAGLTSRSRVANPSDKVAAEDNEEPDVQEDESFASARLPETASVNRNPPRLNRVPAAPLDRTSGEVVGGSVKNVGGLSGELDAVDPRVPETTEFPPAALPKKLATNPTDNAADAPKGNRDGRPEVTRNDDGTEMIRLPDGTLVPFVSSRALKTTPPADGPDPAKVTSNGTNRKPMKLDPKKLEQFMKRGLPTQAPPPPAAAPSQPR